MEKRPATTQLSLLTLFVTDIGSFPRIILLRYRLFVMGWIPVFITSILKSLVVPVIWLALIDAIYSWIAPFFAFNRNFFPANEEATLKTKQPIRIQGFFKVTNQIAGMWKTESTTWQILQLLFPKLLLFPPKKWMNLILDRLSTASIEYLNWPSPVFGLFQKECNKMVIEPHVVQFWSEIILVISNRTYAARSFDFKITRIISAQIALHLVQLPLLILYNQLFIFL